MRTARNVAAFTFTLAAGVGLATPAHASSPETAHGSCADWGHAFAAWAQSAPGTAGAGMSALGQGGLAAAAVHDEKSGLYAGYGVPGCQPR